MATLRQHLQHEPRELGFGTSGRRGEVAHLTQLEIYINVSGELAYLQSREPAQGGVRPGEEFFFARDLRPSSPRIAAAVVRAACDAGMRPVNLGCIPTPALACYALARGRASIMVTGSHIPFDRNGYKLNTARGELLKTDEAPIHLAVRAVRDRIYAQPFADSPFDERGMFQDAGRGLPPASDDAARAYLERYAGFFGKAPLQGQRVLVYQHSAVGRDLLVEMLERLGARVIAAGRSEEFVPIDTENIDAAQLALIQGLADEARRNYGELSAIVSTDGDSDRPLLLATEPDGRVRFFGGDLVGMVVAEFLAADSVVVPISCNDAIDRGRLAGALEPKTRIGSPYVIAAMEEARRKGRRRVCGWEANGGFLTASDIERKGAVLAALPTRDAFLPILSVLAAARERQVPVAELFARLPRRCSRAALLQQFPRAISLRMVAQFSPDPAGAGQPIAEIRSRLESFFSAAEGFSPIDRIDYTDGVRILFANGEVAHFRPSGNADELRIYAVADSQQRADAIAARSVAPDGILRRMAAAIGPDRSPAS